MEASIQEDLKTITKEPKLAFYQGKLFHGTRKEFEFDKNFFDGDNNNAAHFGPYKYLGL